MAHVEDSGRARPPGTRQVEERSERGAEGNAGRAGHSADSVRTVRGLVRQSLRAGWADGLVCASAMAAVGPLLGLLWAASAPRLDIGSVLAGSSAELDVQSGIDVYFGLVTAVAGVVGGFVAFWRAADAGWPAPVGLATGGFTGALLAGWVGHRVRSPGLLDALPADANTLVVDLVDMRVRAGGLYLVYPITALVVLTLLIWVASVRERDRGASPPDDLKISSGTG